MGREGGEIGRAAMVVAFSADRGRVGLDATMSSHGDLAELFGLLGDRTRLQIVMLLSKGPRNVSSLCETLRLPQPTASHHLALLREAGLISNRREGKQIFYSLNGSDDGVDHCFEISAKHYRVRVESAGPKPR